MYTISKYCSYVPFETLVKWACENGAKVLGFEEKLGTITQGKTPGLVQMNVTKPGERFVMRNATVKRLI
jgi:aminodeoxyfutalosine deaminase